MCVSVKLVQGIRIRGDPGSSPEAGCPATSAPEDCPGALSVVRRRLVPSPTRDAVGTLLRAWRGDPVLGCPPPPR